MGKMKNFIKALTLLVSLSNFSAVEAGSVDAGDINSLLFYKGHTGLLIRHQSQIDPDNCGRKDFYILPDDHRHFSQIYAMLLAAQTAGKKVSVTINGCYEGMPAIIHVALEKQ
jgi:hypothetical protein